MKKLILAAIVAVAGWFTAQAQSMPVPEKYNEFLEQAAQLAQMDQAKGDFLMNATMEALSPDPVAYRKMMELAEKRFSDPADPLHNEGLYMAVLQHTTEQFVLSNAEKEKQRLLLEGAKKNMIGTVAADFDYITPKDKTVHHLKDLKADYILVYFNNPDCQSCETVKERLANSELINKLVNEKKLIVLALYPYEDQKLWKKAKYPSMMINGWNQSQQIENYELYDLPTLPCFYLLDKDYKVLIKNEGSLNKVEAKFNDLLSPKAEAPKLETAAQKQGVHPKQPAIQPAKPRPTIIPAPEDDPYTVRSEQTLNLLLENKSQEIYDNLSDKLKAQAKPESFAGALSQIEAQMGKYLGHEAWNIQQVQGLKAYTSIMNFEKAQLGMIVTYNEEGKITGFNIVPAQAIKPQD